jgi:CMP-N,N'-diacetyllegionaminic acid synthase
MDNILVTICARGGSKGVPKKNIKNLCGFPLMYYTIKIAKEFLKDKRGVIVLSTDCEEIKKVAKEYGLKSDYFRPAKLATDYVGKIDVIKDVLMFEERKTDVSFDLILDLDITSPLRTLSDLNNSLKILQNDKEALNIFSVSKSKKNPYFNMVEKKGTYYNKVKEISNIKTRQSAPVVYDMNASFYFYTRKFFNEKFDTVFTNKSLIYELMHECFDIDEPIDFIIMEYLLKNNFLKINI